MFLIKREYTLIVLTSLCLIYTFYNIKIIHEFVISYNLCFISHLYLKQTRNIHIELFVYMLICGNIYYVLKIFPEIFEDMFVFFCMSTFFLITFFFKR
jgi:hypothetical protein